MRVAAHVLVVVVVFAEVDAADHAGLHEQLERAVDGGARDLERLLLHLEEQLVGLEVVVRGEDLAHERGALAGELESLLGEELLELVDLALYGRHVSPDACRRGVRQHARYPRPRECRARHRAPLRSLVETESQ